MSGPKPKMASERFWRFVDKTRSCWAWKGGRLLGGYGKFMDGDQRTVLAHRFSFQLVNGDIPSGMQIDHLCRNRFCVNPNHLEVVFPRENVLRGVGITAQNAKKTVCKRGHSFTSRNTRIKKDGARSCRQCHVLAQKKYLEKKCA